MFANLKNKLIEEVRASPSKFQQLAAQAQAAVSSSTSTTPSSTDSTATTSTNENFFSITEEDTPQNTPLRLPSSGLRGRSVSQTLNNGATSTGAVPRTRKLSNSSMASDISFRLPSYDAPATYHLQSDMESEYGSEFGDEVTSPNKLEVITKEKLFEAYKKSLERYNKYRARYTDLVKQYKELERDSTKARAVLMETQEKALRRINELREQCSLEQGAKAHLEQALRLEMDDMKCKLHAYETQLKLLGGNPENIKITSDENSSNSLIDLDNDTHSNAVNGNSPDNEIISLEEVKLSESPTIERYEDLEKILKIREENIAELNEKLLNCIAENQKLKKQEEENSLLLAQTKQAIHTELEAKESEVKKLKEELKTSQNELQNLAKKEAQITAQFSEIKDLREKLKQTVAAKQEIDAKLIASEHLYSTLKQQNATKEKNQADADEKFKENEHKLQDLRQQNAQLNEMLQRYQQNEVSLAEIDNELNRTKTENDNLRTTLREYEQRVEDVLKELREFKEKSEKELLEKSEELEHEKQQVAAIQEEAATERSESTKRLKQLEELQREMEKLKQNEQETILALRAELQAAHKLELEAFKDQLTNREKELKSTGNKVAKHKKHHETQQHKIKEQTDELEKLRDELNKHAEHLRALHVEAREREEQTEVEKAQLKSQITNIVQEISLMEEQMRVVQQSHAELEIEKRKLEQHIESMQREGIASETIRILELERKVQSMESENSQLAEQNCLLQENANRLEKQLAEKERQQSSISNHENTIQKLNEKMAQILDENSHMHNAQELMDHDYRSLQDKCDAFEKEKLMAEDTRNLLENELESIRAEQTNTLENLRTQQQRVETLTRELEILQEEKNNLLAKMEEMEMVQNEVMLLREELVKESTMKGELLEKVDSTKAALEQKERANEVLEKRLQDFDKHSNEFDHLKEEIDQIRKENDNLRQSLQISNDELGTRTTEFSDLEKRYQKLMSQMEVSADSKDEIAQLREELDKKMNIIEEKNNEIEKIREEMSKNVKERVEEHKSLKQELSELIELEHRAVEQLEEQKSAQLKKIEELEEKWKSANADIEKLHENNVAYQLEIEQLNSKHQLEIQELTATLRRLQDDHSKLQEKIKSTNEKATKLQDYDQIKIENEFLTKHVQQLESRSNSHNEETILKVQEIDELKEKLKSLQCESYVLKENAVEHENQVKSKQIQLETNEETIRTLETKIEAQRIELVRQTEHASFVTEQNDGIQKELLHTQQLLSEAEQKLQALNEMDSLKEECNRNRITIETLNKEVEEFASVLEEKETLEAEIKGLKLKIDEQLYATKTTATKDTESESKTLSPPIESATKTQITTPSNEGEKLRELNAALQNELEKLKQNSTLEINSLQHEIEDLKRNVKESSDRIIELESIRAGLQVQQLLSTDVSAGGLLAPEMHHEIDTEELLKNNVELESKLKNIMNEVHDVSNRNLFLEQQCENYLILEQSNERLKLQNAKLSRQLDETLVSLQHSEGINANTEFEYLKNIMFQYLTGTANGNNETLVKVISAVLKFSPQQTQVALEKEHQRRSLINKIL